MGRKESNQTYKQTCSSKHCYSSTRKSLGHTRSRDHRIARLVTNLGDVRLVAITKDKSLGFIYDLSLMFFGKMHSMIGCDKIRERSCDPANDFLIFIAKVEPLLYSPSHIMTIDKRTDFGGLLLSTVII